MKKNFLLTVIFLFLMSFGLTGCAFFEVRDRVEESDEDARERDEEESEEEEEEEEEEAEESEEEADIEDEFEFYTYSSGSDSVKESFIIYQYRGDLYFASYYFNCGDGYSETCSLSNAQEEAFYRILEEEMEERPEEEDEEAREGAHEVGACVCLDGEMMGIYPIDISETELPFMDVFDMNIQELENIPFEDMDLIRATNTWQNNPFNIDYYAYNYMLEQQIESRISQELVSMTVGEVGEEDYILQAETESGEIHEFTVTIWGYVTE